MLARIVVLGVAACGSAPAQKPAAKPVQPLVSTPKTSDGSADRGDVNVVDKVTPFDESTLQPDVVLQQIQRHYMIAVKRCYKNHLKTDPAARGKIVLSFTVLETGRVANGKAEGFASLLDACIAALIPSWEFPKPLDKDGEKTEANFQIALQLVPD